MKVLLMHRGDGFNGGGLVQMNRLHEGLRLRGVDARILCRDVSRRDSIRMPERPRRERWLRQVTQRLGLNEHHLLSSFAVKEMPEFHDADLIDFHCLHCETLSYLALPGLTRAKPAVFTFHDMWPLTGHCHASLECERWRTGCGHCPHPEISPAVRRDATRLEWRLKRWAYRHSDFAIVTPSRWLFDQVRDADMDGIAVHHIPHGVETDVYRPLDKGTCRELIGVPADKHVIGVAMESMARPLKGADLLVEALKQVPESLRSRSVLLVLGEASPAILKQIPMPVVGLGFVHQASFKAMFYSAADVVINPTRAESFSLVCLESMACGTPVVSFRVGGVPELVRAGTTGLLAQPEHAEELGEQLASLLGDAGGRERMAIECRRVVEREYSIETQTQRYIGLYQQVIRDRKLQEKRHV